jgi:hypothetical protein
MNSLILPTSQGTAEAKTALVRTFPREPAVIELSDEGLRLPTWTTQFSQTFTAQGNSS